MRDNPKVCTVLYGISCLLDAFDGMFARMLNQCSKFGAVLDMVTDRCTTACLLVFLSLEYPRWVLLFQFLITLDFSSHYIHMYSSLVTGSSSHKSVGADVSRILWYYYNDSVRNLLTSARYLSFVLAMNCSLCACTLWHSTTSHSCSLFTSCRALLIWLRRTTRSRGLYTRACRSSAGRRLSVHSRSPFVQRSS